MKSLIPAARCRRIDRKCLRVRPAAEALEVRQVPTSSLLATGAFYPPNPCAPSHEVRQVPTSPPLTTAVFYPPNPCAPSH